MSGVAGVVVLLWCCCENVECLALPVVNDVDLDILVDNWDANLQNPTWADGDLNGDGDIDDVEIFFAQFGIELAVVA